MSKISQRHVIGYLLFNRLTIENANTISGSLIYGTPAITAIKGAFHALSRKIMNDSISDQTIALRGVFMASHTLDILATRNEPYKPYHFMQQKAAIATYTDFKKFSAPKSVPPSVIQQGYCSMTMSFIVEVTGIKELKADEKAGLEKMAYQRIHHQRIAGGNIRPFKNNHKVRFIEVEDLDAQAYQLSNAHILIDASNVMSELIDQHPNMSATDILINACSTHHTPLINDSGETYWQSKRITTDYGYLVPMMVGYHGISDVFEPGVMKNARNSDAGQVRCQYVDSIYSLGQWIHPHQLRLGQGFKSAFWYYDHQPINNLYLITNHSNKDNDHG